MDLRRWVKGRGGEFGGTTSPERCDPSPRDFIGVGSFLSSMSVSSSSSSDPPSDGSLDMLGSAVHDGRSSSMDVRNPWLLSGLE